MRFRSSLWMVFAAAVLLSEGGMAAPLVYALNTTGITGSQFGTIDLATGVYTNIGLTGAPAVQNSSCLGFANGKLYAIFVSNSAAGLYTIDPSSGATTLVGAMPGGVASCAMTASGAMYIVSISGTNLNFSSVNLSTGAPNLIGTILTFSPGSFRTAMGAVNDSLYLAFQTATASRGTLYSIRTLTGAGTPVGPTDAGIVGLASVGGNLYGFATPAFSNTPAHIDIISPATGVFSVGPDLSSATAYVTGAVPGPASYYFSDLAFGGGFQTTLTYVNYSPQPVTCQTNFYSDSGTPLSIPFSQGLVSTRTDVLQPGQSLHDQTQASLTATVAQGWAQAVCSGSVQASLLYRYYQAGVAVGEASVIAETTPTTEFATFAQTATGIAYANPSATQSATITVTVYNAAGAKLASNVINLGPLAHGTANVGPSVGLTNFTGFVKITSTVPIISLSLNAEVFPVFSSLPPGDLPTNTNLVTP